MYLTVLSFQTNFFVKTTLTENATQEYAFQKFHCCIGMPRLRLLSELFEKVVQKIFW